MAGSKRVIFIPDGGSPITGTLMDEPPGTWGGGGVPMPNPPIANVPGVPGYTPPVGGGGTPSHPIALPGDPWWGQDLKPEHPIVLPPPGGEVPPNNPDPGNCKWVYTEKGWVLFCGPYPGGKPKPPG